MIDAARCPFEPGFGATPPLLAGREQVVGAIDLSLRRLSNGLTERVRILEGPRGMGKTSLLRVAAGMAGAHGWHTLAFVTERSTDPRQGFTERIREFSSSLDGRPPKRSTALSVTLGLPGVAAATATRSAEGSAAPAPPLAETLLRSLHAARTGLLITVDEAHELSPPALAHLGTFFDAINGARPSGPVHVLLAGLPGTYARATATTYLERSELQQIRELDDAASHAAIEGPVLEAGAAISFEAIETIVGFAGGYPYALQLAGRFSWEAADGTESITAAHAARGVQAALADLDALYAARWGKLGPLAQHYLGAVALLGTPEEATNAAVASLFGRSAAQLSSTRQDLRDKGLLSGEGPANSWGLPRLADWVRRRLASEREIHTLAELAAAEAARLERRR